MSQFDDDLRESLRRREAPAGFADKVLARTRETEKKPRPATWQWLAVAAMVVLMIGGVGLVREQRRQAEGEKNKEQLMVALRITGSKLLKAQSKLEALQQRTIELQLQQ
jgi:hypothetical protein